MSKQEKPNFKDSIILELKAQNEQLKARIDALEKREGECFRLLIMAGTPLYKQGEGLFNEPLTIAERIQILIDKINKLEK